MADKCLIFENVTFCYPSAAEPVFEGLSARLGAGWTGVIGPNGSGKTTLLRLATGRLDATTGHVRTPARGAYCPQRTDDPPAEFDAFLRATDAPACELRGRFGVRDDWPQLWNALSHGERKRAQIAVAMWQCPGLLAVDEPTNHLDLTARKLLAEALAAFKSVGLLVSHDRSLLDSLCGRTIFIEPPRAVVRPGGYSKAVRLIRAEREKARRDHAKARSELARLGQEAAKRREEASRSHQKRSRRKIGRKDHDAADRIGRARVTGKDTQAGRLLRQMDGRLKQAREALAAVRIERRSRLGIHIPGRRAQRDALLRMPAASLELGPGRTLVHGELLVRPSDRIALTGPNGSGKSTLIRQMVAGADLPAGKMVYLAQEIDAAAAREVVAATRRLGPDRLGEVMTIVSCLGSRPERLLETDQPSPGEVRKLMLAMGMADDPYLIVMDEPTNHLDLPSIECLESALADCPSALLLVSHDLRFLNALTETRWQISPGPDASEMKLSVSIARGGADSPADNPASWPRGTSQPSSKAPRADG